MDQLDLTLWVCIIGGVIAAAIAYTKVPTAGTATIYFIFGALIPIVGIVFAVLMKPTPQPMPPPPGWYPDPWGQAAYRWFDGCQWTGITP